MGNYGFEWTCSSHRLNMRSRRSTAISTFMLPKSGFLHATHQAESAHRGQGERQIQHHGSGRRLPQQLTPRWPHLQPRTRRQHAETQHQQTAHHCCKYTKAPAPLCTVALALMSHTARKASACRLRSTCGRGGTQRSAWRAAGSIRSSVGRFERSTRVWIACLLSTPGGSTKVRRFVVVPSKVEDGCVGRRG